MAITKDDFEKIWASTSPLTPYTFNDAQYKEGWNFVGSTPPSRQMWDAFMQGADEKLKYLYQHEDVPVGHEYFTFNPNVPEGSLPLFGGEYSRETYSALWNWVQQQTGYLKTEAEWQTLATSNNGNVPYYSDGDGSTTFRVPSLKCWVKSANGTVTEVGSYLAAGLPNINGSALVDPSASTSSTSVRNYSGAFEKSSTGNIYKYATNGTIATDYGLKFNASNSNSIYGNSSTVQPESIVGMWLVKAYGVVVDTGQIDEQQYIDDRIATRLPLTGGTMMGAIRYTGANNRSFGFDLTNDGTNMDIGWNWTNRDGAGFGLRSTDDTGSIAGAGGFSIYARNGSNSASLNGTPDGTLTWGGKNVLTNKRTNGTPTVTCNVGTVLNPQYAKIGASISMYFDVKLTSAVNIGGTISGSVSNVPLPVLSCNATSYYGSSAIVVSLQPNGTYNMRVIGANMANGAQFGVNIQYITES